MPLFNSPLPFLNVLISLPQSNAEIPSGNTSENWICLTTQAIYSLPLKQVISSHSHCEEEVLLLVNRLWVFSEGLGTRSDAGAILWKVIRYHHSFINSVFLVSRWRWGKNGPFQWSPEQMSPADRTRLRWKDNETREKERRDLKKTHGRRDLWDCAMWLFVGLIVFNCIYLNCYHFIMKWR